MACEVKTFAHIADLIKVQEFFGLSHEENWLNGVSYAISPTGELIAFALGEKLAFLSSSWDNKQQLSTYVLSWQGELEDPNQIITALICLPIYGKSVSSGAEWTCIAVGLSSGMVAFYTDLGIKIFSQSYHDGTVYALKAYTPPRHSEADSLFYVIYAEGICTVKGHDIFPVLSSMRENTSQHVGRAGFLSRNTNTTSTGLSDALPYQKFVFTNNRETIINDAVVAVGARKISTYDHIVEQSLNCGYYARVSETLMQSTPVIAVGVEPFLGFYQAEEGYKTISFGEVAKDVIGLAYKNVLGRIFKNSTSDSALPPEDVTTPSKELLMRTRCCFYDGKRDGITVIVSQDSRLAVITDNLGRVMLVDVQRAMTVRVWKGYRDAQCAFVPVKERTLKNVSQPRKRTALFLLIYTPRLGCIEIWGLQNGPRIATFSVCKNGQLSYYTHGLMGTQPQAKVKASLSNCLFLDPVDNTLKEFQIPFHYALSEMNSNTSRDIHLLRRLKNLLREISVVNEENLQQISSIAVDFKTVEVRQQCLETLKKNKKMKPEIFRSIIYAFDNALEETDEEQQDFRVIIQNYKRLTDFYIQMQTPMEQTFNETLELCDSDLVIINKILLLFGERADDNTKGISFQEQYKHDGDFVDYLNIFSVNEAKNVNLLKSKSDNFGYIGSKIFGEFFTRNFSPKLFTEAAKECKIPAEDLLMLLVHFYIEKPFVYKNCDDMCTELSRLAAIISAICELNLDIVNNYAYNEVSPWWQKVREMLLESQKWLSLLVAIVCKTVAATLRRTYHEGSCDEGSATEDEVECFEQISHDEAQWSLLIGKLEDISVLGAILEHPILSAELKMPELPYEKPDCSLKAIVAGGKGIVSHLTAQWLIYSRIDPKQIALNAKNKPLKEDETINDEEHTDSNDQKDLVLEKLDFLREHFPFSLEPGVLLCVMTWQYMIHWSKNLSQPEFMRAALTCLTNFAAEDQALKHGICCLLWNATLKFPLQSLAKLMHKVGRLPKDKMCKQDTDMSAALVPEFLDCALEFLEHFQTSLDHDKRDLLFEESLVEGQLPLTFIALQQHHGIKELLQLHYELCTVLHFIAFFQMKFTKPLSLLFDAMSNKAFFMDINKEPNFVLTEPDTVLQQQREQFLCNVINAAMDLIREDLEQLYMDEYNSYIERVYKLANSWNLDKRALQRKQVLEMYTQGYDSHGEDLLKTTTKDEELGRALLEIAGRRLCLCMKQAQDIYLTVASVGPQLLQYIDKIDSTMSSMNYADDFVVDIAELAKLVSHSFDCLSQRDTKYLHIAAQMYDACKILLLKE